MRIPDDLKFSDIWVKGKIPPITEELFDAWVHKVHDELRHRTLRDGMGLAHMRIDDDLEPILNPTYEVKLAGSVTVYARVPREDWLYFSDDVVSLFDDIYAFDVNVDIEHDYYLDE